MWKMIIISEQQIEKETDRAVLIKMPNSSPYKGKSFWHPKKLVRQLDNQWYYSFSFMDDWEFVIKSDREEKRIQSAEMLEYFRVMDEENKKTAKNRRKESKTIIKHHIPEEIQEKGGNVDDDLIR